MKYLQKIFINLQLFSLCFIIILSLSGQRYVSLRVLKEIFSLELNWGLFLLKKNDISNAKISKRNYSAICCTSDTIFAGLLYQRRLHFLIAGVTEWLSDFDEFIVII